MLVRPVPGWSQLAGAAAIAATPVSTALDASLATGLDEREVPASTKSVHAPHSHSSRSSAPG
jgi:hypothetical protein